jgi:DNA-binding NarL/FixJ family response regulator
MFDRKEGEARIAVFGEPNIATVGLLKILEECPWANEVVLSDPNNDAMIQTEKQKSALIIVDTTFTVDLQSEIMRMKTQFNDIPLAVFSAYQTPSLIRQSVDAGASGFISMRLSPHFLFNAIELMMGGGIFLPDSVVSSDEGPKNLRDKPQLTPRQLAVAREIMKGYSNKRIAYNLGLQESTVKVHASAIYRTLQVNSRTEMIIHFHSAEQMEKL